MPNPHKPNTAQWQAYEIQQAQAGHDTGTMVNEGERRRIEDERVRKEQADKAFWDEQQKSVERNHLAAQKKNEQNVITSAQTSTPKKLESESEYYAGFLGLIAAIFIGFAMYREGAETSEYVFGGFVAYGLVSAAFWTLFKAVGLIFKGVKVLLKISVVLALFILIFLFLQGRI